MSVEEFAAQVAGKFLVAMMLAPVSDIIVFTYELAATVLARVWLYLFVRVHVVVVVDFADKCFDTLITFEWFRRAVGVHPVVNFQIPLGAE